MHIELPEERHDVKNLDSLKTLKEDISIEVEGTAVDMEGKNAAQDRREVKEVEDAPQVDDQMQYEENHGMVAEPAESLTNIGKEQSDVKADYDAGIVRDLLSASPQWRQMLKQRESTQQEETDPVMNKSGSEEEYDEKEEEENEERNAHEEVEVEGKDDYGEEEHTISSTISPFFNPFFDSDFEEDSIKDLGDSDERENTDGKIKRSLDGTESLDFQDTLEGPKQEFEC